MSSTIPAVRVRLCAAQMPNPRASHGRLRRLRNYSCTSGWPTSALLKGGEGASGANSDFVYLYRWPLRNADCRCDVTTGLRSMSFNGLCVLVGLPKRDGYQLAGFSIDKEIEALDPTCSPAPESCLRAAPRAPSRFSTAIWPAISRANTSSSSRRCNHVEFASGARCRPLVWKSAVGLGQHIAEDRRHIRRSPV